MAIYRLLRDLTFDSGQTAAMVAAYDGAVIQLKITDQSDPRTNKLAIAILALFKKGMTNPEELQKLVCRVFRFDDAPERAGNGT